MSSILGVFKSLDFSYKKYKAKKRIRKIERAVVGTTSVINVENDKRILDSLGGMLNDYNRSEKFPNLNNLNNSSEYVANLIPDYLHYKVLPLNIVKTNKVVFFSSDDYISEDIINPPTSINDLKGRLNACQVYNKTKSYGDLYPIKNININAENLRLIMLMDYSFDLSRFKSNARISYRYTNFYRNYPEIKDRTFTITISEVEDHMRFNKELPIAATNTENSNRKSITKPKSILKSKLNNNFEKEKYLAAKCDEISTADFIRLVDSFMLAKSRTSKSEKLIRRTERQHRKILVKRKAYETTRKLSLHPIAV